MKKCIHVLVLFILFLSVSGCNADHAGGTKSASGDLGVFEETDIESTAPPTTTEFTTSEPMTAEPAVTEPMTSEPAASGPADTTGLKPGYIRMKLRHVCMRVCRNIVLWQQEW